MSSSSEEIHHGFLFERSDRPWWPTVYHPLSSCCITFCFPLRCFYYSIFFSCLHLPTGLLLATLSRCSISKRELPLHKFLFVKSVKRSLRPPEEACGSARKKSPVTILTGARENFPRSTSTMANTWRSTTGLSLPTGSWTGGEADKKFTQIWLFMIYWMKCS